MKRVAGLVLVAGILSGCVSTSAGKTSGLPEGSPYLVKPAQGKPRPCESLTREQELALNLSVEMVGGQRLHAALANLERLPPELPEARLGKAQVLRLLNRPEAEGLYRSLLDTCLVAEGHHGLAQMAVRKHDNELAQQHLQQAIAFKPTNDAMRNDLGVVYMKQRDLDEARFEFLTAIELNEGESQALRNLLTLMLYQDNFDAAAKLMSRYQLNSRQYQVALGRAQAMKQEDRRTGSTAAGRTAESEATVTVMTAAPAG
ncbi:tetratricopeptide repeat protein [Zobellella sp. DQSA1]|uniref:tetratricopeptide repeat protein n=1 Tax=Zobellella sp. DQSA1 TaxID=3342386 RepID=UPI0035C10CEA